MNDIKNPDFIKNTTTTITLFGENALKTAALYLTHGKRKIVSKEDIKRALILELLIFNKRKIDIKKFNKVKKILYKEENNVVTETKKNYANESDENSDDCDENSDDCDENSDDCDENSDDCDENSDDSENSDVENCNYIVDEKFEEFSLNKCKCQMCDCFNNIYNEWENWEPSSDFEKIFQKHINNI